MSDNVIKGSFNKKPDLLNMRPEELQQHIKNAPLDKTCTLLVEHLKEKPFSIGRDKIISMAERKLYDDFKSPYPAPKQQLYDDLHAAGFIDLAMNTVAGEYDL